LFWRERPKAATRVQTQTVWAPWLQNLADMLEPHLAEIKQQGESKLRHSALLTPGKLLHTMLHWENRRASTATRQQFQTCLGDICQINRWAPSITW
jgi:hypothetical protein